MPKDKDKIKKHTLTTVLSDDEFERFEEARKLSGSSTSEALRRQILEDKPSNTPGHQQTPRRAKVPKINVNFRLPSEVYSSFRYWCDNQVPPWNYGYAAEQAIKRLIEEEN